jgi:tRNA pseudouridine55 synthase
VRAAATRFIGRFMQRVPDVSAVKQAGAPLYKRVRRGETVQAPEREVIVHALEIEQLEAARVSLTVACGKGFYVRALARDLALALGTVGHIASLRRTTSGGYDVRDAFPFDTLLAAAQGDEAAREDVRAALVPPERALADAARVTLSEEGVEHARHGRVVLASHALAGWPKEPECEPVLLLDERARLIALARREGEALRVVRGIKAS